MNASAQRFWKIDTDYHACLRVITNCIVTFAAFGRDTLEKEIFNLIAGKIKAK